MCNPALAVFAVTAAIQAQQQKKASDATNRFNQRRADLVRDAANDAAKSRFAGLAARTKESRELAQQETQNITNQALKAAGVARLSGAGASVGAVISDLAAQKAGLTAGIARREEFSDTQSELEAQAAREQARGRILGAIRPRVGGGEFFNAAISIAGSVAGDSDLDIFGTAKTT